MPEKEKEGAGSPDTNDNNTNNCEESKKSVIALCKELNLIIDPNKISIAHRLKKGRFSKGPRPIIVKLY